VTATIFTDRGIRCDRSGCLCQMWGSQVDMREPITTAEVRRVAARRGWRTAVPVAGGRREDYCPEHAQEERGHHA
jgi:hypothetical protein